MAGNGAGWQRNRGASTFLVIRRGFVSLLSFGGAHSFPMSSGGACRFSLRHPEEAKPTKDLFPWVRRVRGRRSFAALRMTEERESGGQGKENQDDRGKRLKMEGQEAQNEGKRGHRMTVEKGTG